MPRRLEHWVRAVKNLIKAVLPRRFLPVAENVYWRLRAHTSATTMTKKQYEALAALKCMVSYNRYGGYCIPESSRHRAPAQMIMSGDIYEPLTIEFIVSNCGDGDVVHAGTYFGDFLPALASGVRSGARVWAFEPNVENYRCARITLEINGIRNVTLTNAGLGSAQAQVLMQTTGPDGRSLGGAIRIVPGESPEAPGIDVVQLVTVDEVVDLDRKITIVHLDVEGHEQEALAGALRTIRRWLPHLVLEALPESTLLGGEWFRKHILSLGYRIIGETNGNAVLSATPDARVP